MRTVFKYPINRPAINVPRGQVVHVGEQGHPSRVELFAWILGPQRAESQEATMTLYTVGTGRQVPAKTEHVGTIQTSNGEVWHIFTDWRPK